MSEQRIPDESAKDARARARADKAYAKASRPWYKKKRFIIPLLLVVLIVIYALAGGGDDAPSQSSGGSPSVATASEEANATVGAKVRAGNFEFVVTEVENVGKSVPDVFGSSEEAQGEFVLVKVDATNVGDKAETLDSSSQKLFNDKGQEFEPSPAIFTLKDADKFFLTNINPGNTVTGAPLLFDVPAGTKIASIQLTDSPFSNGVKVDLS